MVDADGGRHDGSTDEFESDWRDALRTGDHRWLTYPDDTAADQVALSEWVKAQQVLAILRRHGIATGRILEYGCGAAGMSIYLRRHGYVCVALDRSELALRVAAVNQRLHDPTGAPLTRAAGDVQALPFAHGAFDVVMSYGLLEHFAQPQLGGALHECVRLLRPGGMFVADIVPGRINIRTLGVLLNFGASALVHLARGMWRQLPCLRDAYFDHYYESAFGPADWAGLLAGAGLSKVQVQVCRPLPPLALRGWPEHLYVRLMRRCLPLWRRFDASRSAVAQRWGWMYLCWGVNGTSSGRIRPAP